MSSTTTALGQLIAERDRIDALIQQAQSQPAERRLELPAIAIDLRPGERYAGAVLDNNGEVLHHLVLLPEKPAKRLGWNAAVDWAKELNAELPTRQEQALLFANCKAHVEADWHWSSETYEDTASCAWYCYFNYGNQYDLLKSYEGCVRAVRRIR